MNIFLSVSLIIVRLKKKVKLQLIVECEIMQTKIFEDLKKKYLITLKERYFIYH